jgi:hypothetical protein
MSKFANSLIPVIIIKYIKSVFQDHTWIIYKGDKFIIHELSQQEER